jgi:fucose permease
LIVPRVRRLFRRRTDAIILSVVAGVAILTLFGLTSRVGVAIALVVAWAGSSAAAAPWREAYMLGLVASEQRATVLSFDALMGSAGGVVIQPGLGRVADVSGYGPSYVVGAAITALALPFLVLARREHAVSDPIDSVVAGPADGPVADSPSPHSAYRDGGTAPGDPPPD